MDYEYFHAPALVIFLLQCAECSSQNRKNICNDMRRATNSGSSREKKFQWVNTSALLYRRRVFHSHYALLSRAFIVFRQTRRVYQSIPMPDRNIWEMWSRKLSQLHHSRHERAVVVRKIVIAKWNFCEWVRDEKAVRRETFSIIILLVNLLTG